MKMEKFVPASYEKVSNDIPDDLAFSILSKLPLKSLKRFVCLRKSWALFCDTPHFMNMLRKNFLFDNHSYYNNSSLLLHHNFELYSLSGERYENKVKLDWPNPFQEDESEFCISGQCSINGNFCLCSYSQSNIRFVLWNPATEEFMVIPPSPFQSVPYIDVKLDQHGFGHDCVMDDYKVIQRVMYYPKEVDEIDMLQSEDTSYDLFWEIYSLKTNSWRKLPTDGIDSYDNDGVYINGMCHWWGENQFSDELYLVSFDFINEVFIITPVQSNEKTYLDHLVLVLSGHVALASYFDMTIHISVLGELGVMESWVNLFIIGPLQCINDPIGIGKNGIFFRKACGKLICIDLSTQMIYELGVTAGEGVHCKMVIYEASFLPIGGINN